MHELKTVQVIEQRTQHMVKELFSFCHPSRDRPSCHTFTSSARIVCQLRHVVRQVSVRLDVKHEVLHKTCPHEVSRLGGQHQATACRRPIFGYSYLVWASLYTLKFNYLTSSLGSSPMPSMRVNTPTAHMRLYRNQSTSSPFVSQPSPKGPSPVRAM